MKAFILNIPMTSYNKIGKRNKSYPGTIEHLNPYCLDYGPPQCALYLGNMDPISEG